MIVPKKRLVRVIRLVLGLSVMDQSEIFIFNEDGQLVFYFCGLPESRTRHQRIMSPWKNKKPRDRVISGLRVSRNLCCQKLHFMVSKSQLMV